MTPLTPETVAEWYAYDADCRCWFEVDPLGAAWWSGKGWLVRLGKPEAGEVREIGMWMWPRYPDEE